jgi:hypothetical protein
MRHWRGILILVAVPTMLLALATGPAGASPVGGGVAAIDTLTSYGLPGECCFGTMNVTLVGAISAGNTFIGTAQIDNIEYFWGNECEYYGESFPEGPGGGCYADVGTAPITGSGDGTISGTCGDDPPSGGIEVTGVGPEPVYTYALLCSVSISGAAPQSVTIDIIPGSLPAALFVAT